METVLRPHASRVNDICLHQESVLTVSSDRSCRITDLETRKVTGKVAYDTSPLKIEIHATQKFVIVTDEHGSIFFHDFRDRLGARRLVDDSRSPISCILKSDTDILFFDQNRNSRLIDFRTNQIVLDKRMSEIVNCGAPSKDSRFVFVGDTDIRLVNKLSMDVKMVHKVDRGPIFGMARLGGHILSGGFDTELKVT